MGRFRHQPRCSRRPARRAGLLALVLCAAVAGSSGCAALTNPTAEGVPARLVPPELLAPSKAGEQTVPLNLLRQPAPAEHRLAPGDILGVYIESFLGDRAPAPPVHIGGPTLTRDQRRVQASMGYPVPVQGDGTI